MVYLTKKALPDSILFRKVSLSLRQLLKSDNKMSTGPTRKVPYHLFVIFFILALAIALTGYFFYQNQKKLIREDKQNELSAIADLKISQITSWREERMKDASFIFNNEEIAEQIKSLGKNPASSELRRKTLGWMTPMFKNRQYKSMRIVTHEGKILISVPEGKMTISPYVKADMAEALRLRKILFSDLYRDEDDTIYMHIIIPILGAREGNAFTVGAVVLRIIPHNVSLPADPVMAHAERDCGDDASGTAKG